MEKTSCEIIRDLLPLYNDDVCSGDSRKLVEVHLEQCSDCRRLLEKIHMDCQVGDATEQENEAFIKDLSAGWKKSVKRNFIKGVVLTLFACLLLGGIVLGLWRLPLVQVSADSVEAEVVAVSDDTVDVKIEVTDGRAVRFMTTEITEDGRLFIILKRGVISPKKNLPVNWSAEMGLPRTYMAEGEKQVAVREIYYGESGDSILIWSE